MKGKSIPPKLPRKGVGKAGLVVGLAGTLGVAAMRNRPSKKKMDQYKASAEKVRKK